MHVVRPMPLRESVMFLVIDVLHTSLHGGRDVVGRLRKAA
jgi:hypothetical protein